MTNKIILFITLLSFSIIVSQSFMYILSLKDVQLGLQADAYTEVRKLTDASMRSNFKYVIYAALLFTSLLMIMNFKDPGSLVFIAAGIAFITLIADIVLTLKGSLPINDIINSWTADTIPSNWADYRAKWFRIFQYRQVANITGFVSLLLAVVFKK